MNITTEHKYTGMITNSKSIKYNISINLYKKKNNFVSNY